MVEGQWANYKYTHTKSSKEHKTQKTTQVASRHKGKKIGKFKAFFLHLFFENIHNLSK
jgi:hypothetical protein